MIREVPAKSGLHLLQGSKNLGRWDSEAKTFIMYKTEKSRRLRGWPLRAEVFRYLQLHGCKELRIEAGRHCFICDFFDAQVHHESSDGPEEIVVPEKYWRKETA